MSLLVKLADRLHNMRTLHHVPKEERRHRIAHETMDIYAPLAERIGMHDIKDELEDRAFRELYPDARDSITRRLEFLRSEGESVVEAVLGELRDVFAEAGIEVNIAGREKSPYSIWRKMQRTHSSVEQLSDIIAFRVVVPTVPDCYQALGVVHGRYQVVPGRFKDYISTPKPNGYRSLHTSVIGPRRSPYRNSDPDSGHARTWPNGGQLQHTGFTRKPARARRLMRCGEENRQYRWLQELLEILENAVAPEDFLAHTAWMSFRSGLLLFPARGSVFAAARRNADRLCLCRP